MKKMPKLRPTGWDVLTALCVAAIALACWLPFLTGQQTGSGLEAVVSVDGEELRRLPLEEGAAPADYTFSNHGYTLQVETADGGVTVRESDCPTQDCVRTGTVSRPGQSIVCLPARISIQVVRADGSQAPDDVDTIVQ